VADWKWNNGELTRVLYRLGSKSDGTPRFRRAPFDFLYWDFSGSREGYVVIPTADAHIPDSSQVNDSLQTWEGGHLYGYYGVEEKVLTAEGREGLDTWAGPHSFGYL